MNRLLTVLFTTVAIVIGQCVTVASEGNRSKTDLTQLKQIVDRLRSIDERLRVIESNLDVAGRRSYNQNLETLDVYPVDLYATPGDIVVPGQILGRIGPHTGG